MISLPAKLTRMRGWALALSLVLGASFGSANAQAPSKDDVAHAIQALLAAAGVKDASDLSLRRFYDNREDAPAWYGGPNSDAARTMLIAAIGRASADGLEPDRFPLPASEAGEGVSAIASRDVSLTATALRFARELRSGRSDLRMIDRDIDLSNTYDPTSDLAEALRNGDIHKLLANLPPRFPAYGTLKIALARYRAISVLGGWAPLDIKLPVHISDLPSDQGTSLQRRLAVEEESVPISDVSDTESALRSFQVHHGLEPDGVIGANTLAALNVPVSTRILQIMANMERLRWLPHDVESSYVLVNAPEAMLYVFKNDKVLFSSRVIVGRPNDPTPIFRGEITAVIANPPWKVPDVIARKEMLPALRRNARYLADHHIVLENGPPGDPYGTSINWRLTPANGFPYRLQQLPGDDNALGTVKLDVSDPFAVYLHDTPAKALFSQSARTFSHGCIRVQQIKPLASYALSGDEASGLTKLNDMIATTTTQRAGLKAPIPLYVLYETAFVSADGILQFRPDIYARDERMMEALRGLRSAGLMTAAGCTNG